MGWKKLFCAKTRNAGCYSQTKVYTRGTIRGVDRSRWQTFRSKRYSSKLQISCSKSKPLVIHNNWNTRKRLLNSYYILQIDQPNLGLPSRDYYLHAESQRDLQVYFEYMTDVAMIMGANKSEAEKQLHDVIELEIQLANVSCIKHISSLILRIYNKRTRPYFQE